MTGTSLAPLSDDSLRLYYRTADALAQSKVFGDVDSAGKALAKILIGRDIGLNPAQALAAIHLVETQKGISVQMHYTLLGAQVRRAGYDYRVLEYDDQHAKIAFYGKFEQVEAGVATGRGAGTRRKRLGVSEFTIEKAKRQGVYKQGGAWTKTPEAMLIARALSQGVRFFTPDATFIPLYVEGEVEHEPQLTEGSGDGEAQGLDLGPKVESVLERAAELGHAGLADRATAEMTLGRQGPEFVTAWVRRAEDELDMLQREREATEPVEDAELVPDDIETTADHIQRLREEAQGLHATADAMPDEQGDEAMTLRDMANAKEAKAAMLEHDDQIEL